MKKILLILGFMLLISSGYALESCLGYDRSFISLCSNVSDGSCQAHEYYTLVGFTNYPCEWTGTGCGVYGSPCSTTTTAPTTTTTPIGNYTTVTYDTGTLPVMNPGTTPGINQSGFGGGATKLFGIAIQSFILICCFLIILIIMCTVKPVYFGILVAVLTGDFIIYVMQLMSIPASLYLLINALAIINFFRGVRG